MGQVLPLGARVRRCTEAVNGVLRDRVHAHGVLLLDLAEDPVATDATLWSPPPAATGYDCVERIGFDATLDAAGVPVCLADTLTSP